MIFAACGWEVCIIVMSDSVFGEKHLCTHFRIFVSRKVWRVQKRLVRLTDELGTKCDVWMCFSTVFTEFFGSDKTDIGYFLLWPFGLTSKLDLGLVEYFLLFYTKTGILRFSKRHQTRTNCWITWETHIT